jgi:putative tricarboxylic transport membrane protein
MVKSPAWKEVLKQKGWADAFMPSEAFAKFLKDEQVRVRKVLSEVGLVKS